MSFSASRFQTPLSRIETPLTAGRAILAAMLTAPQAEALLRALARSLDVALRQIPDDTPPREVAVRLGWVAARVILGAVRA